MDNSLRPPVWYLEGVDPRSHVSSIDSTGSTLADCEVTSAVT